MPVLKRSEDGSLLIPADLLGPLGLAPGDRVVVEADAEGRLVLTRSAALAASAEGSLRQAIARKNLETPMQFIKGVGPKMAEVLARKGIITVEDALYLLPNRYEDRRQVVPMNRLRPGETCVFAGEVVSADVVTTKGGAASSR